MLLIDKKKNLKIAFEIQKCVKKNKKNIALNIIKDTKKNYNDAFGEVQNSLNILNYAIKEFKKINLYSKTFKKKNSEGQIYYEPVGNIALITPWNYPLLTIFERLPFALLSGCKIYLKPSEFTPNFNLNLKKIFENNTLIKKQVSVILSKNKTRGQLLTKSKNIDMITFVGSANTAKKIIKQSGDTIKKFSFELGGKNLAIILDNNFNEKVINEIIFGIFENSGRACVAISKILINDKIYNKFKNNLKLKISEKIQNQKIYIKPIQNFEKNKINKTLNILDKKINLKDKNYITKDGKIICLLVSNRKSKYDKFLEEEFFFPIVAIETFKKKEDLVKKANNSKYGLACYVFSKNKKKINNFIKYLKYGRLWINSGPTVWHPSLPVGGKKLSGNSFEMGSQGFYNYLIPKSIYNRRLY